MIVDVEPKEAKYFVDIPVNQCFIREHDYKLVVYSSLASDVGGADKIKFSYSPEDI